MDGNPGGQKFGPFPCAMRGLRTLLVPSAMVWVVGAQMESTAPGRTSKI